ncbi:MAG TPA: class I SAM-dependent methyltransferase [Blastocatellia bacterium]|nr:class I SAM-dependent methyltransferase [Blastocatellia bacterium]
MIEKKSETEASYDLVAEDYAAKYLSELDQKPFDRDLLAEFSTALHGRGAVCDLGCGPGHITRFLKDRGLDVRGIDLSGEMIQRARRVNPDIKFEQGDMTSLRLEHDLFAGIVCFYAIIHIPREGVRQALAEMNRVLKPGGELLLALHGGEGSIRREEWYGRPVSLSVTLFDSEEMCGYLRDTGFEISKSLARGPYDFEYPTQRLYVWAVRNEGATR